MQVGGFPEMYNDLEGLTLKHEWLIFIEKDPKIGSVSWLLSSAFIKPLKQNSPGVVSKRKHSKMKTKARSMKHPNLKNKFKFMFLKFSYRTFYRDNLVLLRFKYVSCLNVKVFE